MSYIGLLRVSLRTNPFLYVLREATFVDIKSISAEVYADWEWVEAFVRVSRSVCESE
jgi:hypothetical protein